MQLEGQLFDQYRFMCLLRSGGMGEVYLAEDEQLHRRVAIKVIWTDTSYYADPITAREAAHLFLREAQAVAQLDHMHILPVYDSGEKTINGVSFMYMVMPFRDKGSFTEWLQKRNKVPSLTTTEVERVVEQAASALQHAHNHQIIHQDVKPSNFLIYSDGEHSNQLHLQLADFGIAKFMTTTNTTQTVRGTAIYMAPEQWDGHPVPATDQYALAIMAYELLTGRPPFTGKNSQHLWHQHYHIRPQPPSAINPNTPQELDAVLLRALEKKPGERFGSISAFAHAFVQASLNSDNSIRAIPQEGEVVTLANHATVARTVPAFNVRLDQRQKKGFKGRAILFLSLIFVLLIGSVSLLYITRVRQSNDDTHAITLADTATVRANTTTLAYVNATSTGQTNVTTTAQVANAQATATTQAGNTNATATAQTQLNATATVQAANATATIQSANASATAATYATAVSGTLALDDNLQDNNQGHNWDTTTIVGGGGCAFINGAYHSSMPQTGYFSPCFAQVPIFSNFSYQVQMTIVKGDQGGIAFRANASTGSFYYFHINRNGRYGLEVYNNDLSSSIISEGSSPAINMGLNQPNLIAIIANGNNLDLYINMQHITSTTDGTYSQGQIGVIADNTGNATDVVFSNIKVWTRY